MLLNKRGAALLQVLIVTAILAGIAAMVLRLSLSRTITSRQTRHVINAQTVIESCMAEVNTMWAAKTPEAYARDLKDCQMCDQTADASAGCDDTNYQKHTCTISLFEAGSSYTVEAKIARSNEADRPRCKITYTILNGRDTL